MQKIELWKDREARKLDPTLFSLKAEEMAKTFARENEDSRGKKENRRTQIRKFYDEVLRLNQEAQKRPKQWDSILPLVHMLSAKAAYAKGRELVSEGFLNFIKETIQQVQTPEDLFVFANFFEAFMGFYRQHCQSN